MAELQLLRYKPSPNNTDPSIIKWFKICTHIEVWSQLLGWSGVLEPSGSFSIKNVFSIMGEKEYYGDMVRSGDVYEEVSALYRLIFRDQSHPIAAEPTGYRMKCSICALLRHVDRDGIAEVGQLTGYTDWKQRQTAARGGAGH